MPVSSINHLSQSNPHRGSEVSYASKYSLSPDPTQWDAGLLSHHPEPDDDLHNPDPRRDRNFDSAGSIMTLRGLMNLGCLAILALALVSLLYVLVDLFLGSLLTPS